MTAIGHVQQVKFLDTLAEACEKTDWQVHAFAQDLQGRRESAPQKVRIVSRLRRETRMTLEWTADRLCMGVATHVASLLPRHNEQQPSGEETLF